MKQNAPLTTASLISIVLTTIHIADDIVRRMEKGDASTLAAAVPILVIWLYGTLVLPEQRSGHVIMLLGGLLGSLVPVIHFNRPGGVAHDEIATSPGALTFVWTQLALGVSAGFAVILSARGLWRLLKGGGLRTR